MKNVRSFWLLIAAFTVASLAHGADVVSVWGGARSTIILKSDGSVWMWGANDQGQCGEGTTNNDCWRPVPVVGLGPRVPLPLSATAAQPGYANLSWSSATGQFFTVEASTNPATGFTGWQNNVLSTPPTNQVNVPLTNGAMFYRLKF